MKRSELKSDPERQRVKQQEAAARRQAKVAAAKAEPVPGHRWTGFRWVPCEKTGAGKARPVEKKPRPRSAKAIARKKDSPELVVAKAERRLISNDVCEVDGCGNPASNFHHRWLRSQGGVHEWWNLLHVCSGGTETCHERIHAHPAESYAKGYMLRRSDGLAEQQRRANELAALIEGNAA